MLSPNNIKRALPASVLIALLLTVIFVWRPFSGNPDWVWVEVPVRSSASGFSVLKTNHGEAMRNRSTSDCKVITGEQILRYRIPGGPCTRFVISLVDCPAEIMVGRARFVSQEGEVLLQPDANAWRADESLGMRKVEPDLRSISSTKGPQIMELDLGRGVDFESGHAPSVPLLLSVAALLTLLLAIGASIFDERLRSLWKVLLDLRSVVVARASNRPVVALSITAALAVMMACFPVVFLGKSFVSPSTGGQGIYGQSPPIPGIDTAKTEEFKGSDVLVMQVGHRPYSMLAHEAVFERGEFPLWDRYNSCGATFIGQGLSMMGDPLNWVPIAANGAAWAWDVKFLVARWLFAFGIGLCVLAATRRFLPSAGAALGAAFLGFFAYRFNHPANISVCYAPWILLCWQQIARLHSARSVAGWALALALSNTAVFHSGTAKESSMLIVFLNMTGALLHLFQRGPGWGGRFAAGSVGGLVFALLNAPFWLSFLDALGKSFTTYEKPPIYQIMPGHLIGLFDDLFYQRIKFAEWFTDPSANFLVLGGVLIGVVRWRELWRAPLVRALALSSALPFALAFGFVPPEVIRRIPFIANISHVGNTFSCILILHAMVFAGLAWTAKPVRREWPVYTTLLAALTVVYWIWRLPDPGMPLDIASAAGFGTPSPFFVICSTVLLVAVAMLPWAVSSANKSQCFLPRFALLLIAAVALFRHAQWSETSFDYYVINPQPRPDFSVTSRAVERLKPFLSEPARVHGIGGAFIPGYSATLGIEHFSSADALTSGYLHDLVDAATIKRQWEWRTLLQPEHMDATQKWTDLLNNRYFLGARGEMPPESYRHLFSEDLEAWESPTVWPRAFFTNRLLTYNSVADFAALVNGATAPFAAVQKGVPISGTGTVVPATNYALRTNSTRFEIDAPSSGIVALAETWFDGDIQVTLNGESSEAFRVNHAFRGVRISAAGKYSVEFSYWPRVLTKALWLCAFGCLGSVALALVACRRWKFLEK